MVYPEGSSRGAEEERMKPECRVACQGLVSHHCSHSVLLDPKSPAFTEQQDDHHSLLMTHNQCPIQKSTQASLSYLRKIKNPRSSMGGCPGSQSRKEHQGGMLSGTTRTWSSPGFEATGQTHCLHGPNVGYWHSQFHRLTWTKPLS